MQNKDGFVKYDNYMSLSLIAINMIFNENKPILLPIVIYVIGILGTCPFINTFTLVSPMKEITVVYLNSWGFDCVRCSINNDTEPTSNVYLER